MNEAIPALRRSLPGFTWEGVETRDYKDETAAPFKGIVRRVLASDPRLAGELRYFEVARGGYSTLERHEHMHAVMILRGEGRVLVGTEVFSVAALDLVTIEGWKWHQFRASPTSELGFLCLVDAARDRPLLPTAGEMADLRADPRIAAFLDGAP
jgi:quercetin dioxygenase-like cupin family protein